MPKKLYTGDVISDKMDKTVTVAITSLYQHPRYKKTMKHTLKVKAHDEQNMCKIGDRVSVMEGKPVSKTKRWVVVNKQDKKEHADDTG
ncbi:30S ribosomal protein S17 [Candidatus Magnetomonas plexicatena]|uniref:30S ribosomal protein S17 n=1 Tax=Candidatus Magnetomonas plexicatena TaxID=2552947 RepID=UPI001103384A|nr:30S ribosomal protein S17 [Nitrospirales bacterium LBB_01]